MYIIWMDFSMFLLCFRASILSYSFALLPEWPASYCQIANIAEKTFARGHNKQDRKERKEIFFTCCLEQLLWALNSKLPISLFIRITFNPLPFSPGSLYFFGNNCISSLLRQRDIFPFPHFPHRTVKNIASTNLSKISILKSVGHK